MATPFRNKVFLWRSTSRGLKSRFRDEVQPSALRRSDIPDIQVTNKIKRGDRLQKLRLKYYPSIDVDLDLLYAGEIEGGFEDAKDKLMQLGFRNNPTAYVEVTDEHGPDDGSFALQQMTEDSTKFDIPRVTNQPSLWKRQKLQTHVVVYVLEDKVKFAAHKELSAWLQPARHVWTNEASARIGVRDFRDIWFDEFEEELNGKSKVKWDTTH